LVQFYILITHSFFFSLSLSLSCQSIEQEEKIYDVFTMTLSLKKMSVTSEDPPKVQGIYNRFVSLRFTFNFNLEHDWESYLIETNSQAAPACNFKQVRIVDFFS
jgi:hypothetical protein